MLVILDTSVLLSALLSSRGAPSQIIEAWEQSRLTLAVSPELLEELREVAQRPFFRERLGPGRLERLVASLRDLALWFHQLPATTDAPDPEDKFLLGLAEASRADFLVSGDKGLLGMEQYKSTRIVTPAILIEFLKSSESEQREPR